MVTCGLGSTNVVYGSTAVNDETTEGCGVSKYYEVLKFTCKHTEPDKTDTYHMELDDTADDSTTKVKIKQEGWYSISFTALLTTNDKQNRAEIYKISSKDPDSACGAATTSCNALLQLRGKDSVSRHLQLSLVHSHWSRNVEAWLSLVETIIVLLLGALERKISPLGGILLSPRWFFMA